MPFKGAVKESRSLLSILGGNYHKNSPYLSKRSFYDFGPGIKK